MQKQDLGYSTLPQWVSMAQILPGTSISDTTRAVTTGMAADLPHRHSTTFENSLWFYIHCPLPMHFDCKWIQAETMFCWCASTLNNRTVAIGEGLKWYLKAEVHIQYFWAWTNFSKNVIIQTYNLAFVTFNFIPYFQPQLGVIPIHCHLTEKAWSCTRCCYPHSAMDTSFPTSIPLLPSVWINKVVI